MYNPRRSNRWKKVKEVAFRRDAKQGARCWICGGEIDYTLRFPHPDAYEADHKVPVSKRPDMAFYLSNLMPSHSSCNRARGDKEYKTVDKTSEEW